MGMDSVRGATQASTMQLQTASQRQSTQTVEAATQVVEQRQYDASQKVTSAKSDNNTPDGRTGDDGENKNLQTDIEAMKNVAKDVNKIINKNTVAEFGYHEATHRVTIKIKDKDTDEVIKEIPSEKALEMLEKAWEIAGILVDEKR